MHYCESDVVSARTGDFARTAPSTEDTKAESFSYESRNEYRTARGDVNVLEVKLQLARSPVTLYKGRRGSRDAAAIVATGWADPGFTLCISG